MKIQERLKHAADRLRARVADRLQQANMFLQGRASKNARSFGDIATEMPMLRIVLLLLPLALVSFFYALSTVAGILCRYWHVIALAAVFTIGGLSWLRFVILHWDITISLLALLGIMYAIGWVYSSLQGKKSS